MQVHTTLNRLPSSSSASSKTTSHSLSSSLVTPAILLENDPHPSWTFFHPSATYIPHAPYSPPPTSTTTTISPRSSPTLSPNLHRQQPPSSNNNNNKNIPSSTPSTHHRILDHCFHVSIETRLKQAEAQYLAFSQEQAVEQHIKQREELHQPPMSALKQDDWRRRQRTLVDEAVVLGRKGSNVEAIVDGILKSHRSSGPLQTLPRHLKHRLHLCQLTSMVFGRFDVASSTNNTTTTAEGLNVYSAFQSRCHGTSRPAAIIQQHLLVNSPQGQRTRSFFAQPVSSASYCRRHHRKDCQRTCCTLAKMQQQQQKALEQHKKANTTNNYVNNSNIGNARKSDQQRVAGLVDAIPAFLKCSAMSYRDIAQCLAEKKLKGTSNGSVKDKDQNEGRVLEGWYRLLLEMMTQAVIEAYLCDGRTGVEILLDVFSYGDLPEDQGETAAAAAKETSEENGGINGSSFQTQQQQQGQTSNVSNQDATTTQDRQDDILFAKTAEYDAFKQAKDQRLQEFLTMNDKSVEEHFVDIASKYPLIVFERQMTHYIARSQKLLADPKLSRSTEDMQFLIPPATSAYADGSLSMPVSDDDDDEMEEEVTRLEEIKEEEEDSHSANKKAAAEQQRQQQVRVRHEKMKLATITSSMDDDTPFAYDSWSHNQRQHNQQQQYNHGHNSQYVCQDFPSPPPSEVASRSSTVSPQTSSASLSEEEESSIAEAARILVSNNGLSNGSSNNSNPKKHHRHSVSSTSSSEGSVKVELFEDRHHRPEVKLGRAVKKMRV
ncbi:hypothetical protein BGZ95_011133 [Linnemannia exigua]|uniref:Uncharacterized protein n=1 Tax=Linnemannia exigua TaxID=604196 RepID=A0AAD4DAE2_9FUNG|nr:hypothetical protein BGZ95_011133 [Linnemannia exigua]